MSKNKLGKHRLIIFGLAISILCGCIKGKDNPQPPAPAKAILLFPLQNEVCATGENQTSTESTVHFDWSDAVYADSYVLSVKNLNTGVVTEKTSAVSDLKLTLPRGMPFSWSVTSKSSKNIATALSDSWKFYNSGLGQVFYAPFPANLTFPAMGQAVSATGNTITLTWAGSDADGDIAGYDIYTGKNSTLALTATNKPDNQSLSVTVTPNTIYYWKVVTKDVKGNSSDSEVYQFKVN